MSDHAIYTLSFTVAVALLTYVILWSGLQTFNVNPTKRFMRIWLKLALYYAAYTMPMWALLTVIGWSQNVSALFDHLLLPVVLGAVILMMLYFYTVIVQPNRLRLHHQTIDLNLQAPLTLAVLADVRIGLYNGKPRHIRKLVAMLNSLSVDAVLITGDWLYYPGADLVGQLMLFKGVNKPIYTVMSTSDLRYQSVNTIKQGQPLLEDTLSSAFEVADITYIEQYCTPLAPKYSYTAGSQLITDYSVKSQNSQATVKEERLAEASIIAMLCGWQDVPKQLTDSEMMNACNKEALGAEIASATKPVLILASRFDSITDLPKSLQSPTLLIAGAAKTQKGLFKAQQRQAEHQTGGKQTLFDDSSIGKHRGLYQHGSTQIFVSTGIGTRGLPFRLSRPTVDVLTIR